MMMIMTGCLRGTHSQSSRSGFYVVKESLSESGTILFLLESGTSGTGTTGGGMIRARRSGTVYLVYGEATAIAMMIML